MNTPLDNSSSPSSPTPLPVSLFDVIAWVESKNNPHAMRFESAVYVHLSQGPGAWMQSILDKITKIHSCSHGTAMMIYSTSFGATQIMGFNLYDGLYAGDVASFMSDPIAQVVAFDSFCAAKHVKCSVTDIAGYPMVRTHFAKIYNGNADAYAAQIVYALQHFGIAVTQ